VVAMAYMSTQAALAMVLDIAAGTRSVLCARLAQLKTDTIFCLTALHTVTYVSSIATFFIRLHLQ